MIGTMKTRQTNVRKKKKAKGRETEEKKEEAPRGKSTAFTSRLSPLVVPPLLLLPPRCLAAVVAALAAVVVLASLWVWSACLHQTQRVLLPLDDASAGSRPREGRAQDPRRTMSHRAADPRCSDEKAAERQQRK